MDILLTGLNTLISAAFALMALRQYLLRRKIFQLVWLIALTTFTISAGCEFVLTITKQWTAPLYIIWYLMGAMLGAVYFGQGTAYFLLPRRWAHVTMALVLALSAYGTYLTLTTPVNLSVVYPAIPSGAAYPSIREAGWETPRALTPFLNLYGFVWLNGGALYSAVQLARRRMEKHRVMANVLIAMGGTLVGIVSTLNRFGYHEAQYPGEMVGIALMFWGFMLSTKAAPAPAPSRIVAEPST